MLAARNPRPAPRSLRAVACAAVLTASCVTPAALPPATAVPAQRPSAAGLAPEALAAEEHERALREVELRARVRAAAPQWTPATAYAVADVLLEAELQRGLDPVLVLAVMRQESRFDIDARGPRGALGLMQVRPFVAADVAARHGLPWAGDRSLLDAPFNVRIGTRYLAEMLAMFDSRELALAAYNMGPYRVRRWLRRGRTPRPAYVDKVLAHYADLDSGAHLELDAALRAPNSR